MKDDKLKSTANKGIFYSFIAVTILSFSGGMFLGKGSMFSDEKSENPTLNIESLSKIEDMVNSPFRKNSLSQDEKAVLTEIIQKNDYGRIIEIYDTEISNIKEVYSPEGVFYLTEDGKYAIFGDIVNSKTNVSETNISNRVLKSQVAIANASNTQFSRNKPRNLDAVKRLEQEPVKEKNNDKYAQEKETNSISVLDKSIPSKSESAKPLTSEDLKLLSQIAIKNTNIKESTDNLIFKKEAVESDHLEKEKEKLEEFKKQWKERIKSKMATSYNKIERSEAMHGSHPQEYEEKTRIDMTELQTGGSFVTYKGQRKSKIGFDTEGKKLSEEETRNQVKDFYNRLDKIGEKWSVVYPAIGEEKAGVMVFSDPTCPYCQKLHASMDELNEAGVKVTVLMYPRALSLEKTRPELANKVMGSLHSAWCSPNPNASLEKLYKGLSIPTQDEACSIAKEQGRVDFPAAYQYFLGKMFNIKGTPLSFTNKGYLIRGFSNTDKFLKNLGITKEEENNTQKEISISGLQSSDEE